MLPVTVRCGLGRRSRLVHDRWPSDQNGLGASLAWPERKSFQKNTEGRYAPAGSLYSPKVISVMGWMTGRPFLRFCSAVICGCKAALSREALHEAYIPRIQRGNAYFPA